MLIQEEKISEDLAAKIRQWYHSGFNIHNEVEISADDEKGRQTLAKYIIKALIRQERMVYYKENQKVIYKSKHGTILYDTLERLVSCYHNPYTQ